VTEAGLPEGCKTPIIQRSGWPEHCVWNAFTIKTLLEGAGPGMGTPSAGPCLSGAWVSGTPYFIRVYFVSTAFASLPDGSTLYAVIVR
jgi:hypothetical protein